MGKVISLAQFRLSKEEPATSEEQLEPASPVASKKKPKKEADALPDRIFFRYNVEGAGLGVSRLTYERAKRRNELIDAHLYDDDFDYADYGPDPVKQEYLGWWTRNIAPLSGWKLKKSRAKRKPDWRVDPVLAPLLDKRRKGSTLRKQLAKLDETGDYSTLRAWLTFPTMFSSSDGVLSILINNQILRTFARAGYHEEFIPVLARYAQHVSIGTDPANSGPLCGTYVMLPIRPYYNP